MNWKDTKKLNIFYFGLNYLGLQLLTNAAHYVNDCVCRPLSTIIIQNHNTIFKFLTCFYVFSSIIKLNFLIFFSIIYLYNKIEALLLCNFYCCVFFYYTEILVCNRFYFNKNLFIIKTFYYIFLWNSSNLLVGCLFRIVTCF